MSTTNTRRSTAAKSATNGNGRTDTVSPVSRLTAEQQAILTAQYPEPTEEQVAEFLTTTERLAAEALAAAEQAAEAQRKADIDAKALAARVAAMTPTERAMYLCRRSGKSKPSVKYTKPQADVGGFVAAPSLTVRVEGWDGKSIATELRAQGQKPVGSMSRKEAESGTKGQWVKGESGVAGVDMADALDVLVDAGCVR